MLQIFLVREKMLKERVPCADIVCGMEEKMKICDIQEILRDDVAQIERTLERIRKNRIHGQSSATQPQHQNHKPRDGQQWPPKVIYWHKGV